jgi:hypothetical protein
MPVATIVIGIRNSISAGGSVSASVTASASVIRVTDRRRGHHPQSVPRIAESVDRRQRQQEQNVVHGLDVDDMTEAKLDESRQGVHCVGYAARPGSDFRGRRYIFQMPRVGRRPGTPATPENPS